ncbi:MAG TPA: hypothetical protein VGJ91_23715 [Polyangiaceae bacterium]
MRVSPAQAADRVALAYDATAGCPSEADFKAAVEGRGGHFAGPGAPGAPLALQVSITRQTGGFRGQLQAMNEDATSAEREVHGATCQEVVDALAVVSATALNPEAESPAAPSAPAAPAPAVIAVPTPAPAPASEGHLRATDHVSNAKIPVEAGTLRFDLARALTLSGGVELGLLPHTVLPRYDLALTAASLVTTPGGKTFMNGIILRLRLSYLGQATYKADDARSEVQGLAFALSTCWSPIYDTRGWVALLCGEYGAGALDIRSKDLNGTQTQRKGAGIGFAGLGVDTQYNLGSLFHVGFKLGADFFVDSFGAERPDGSSIFRSSQFAGYGMLGFGAHF